MSRQKGFDPSLAFFGVPDSSLSAGCTSPVDDDDFEDADLQNIPKDYDDIDFNNMDGEIQKFQQDGVVQEALLRTVDLSNYYSNIQSELATVEAACVEDYISQAEMLADLYTQMHICEKTLDKMEGMLGSFQQDLSIVSDRIRDLQSHSMSIGVKLTNRKYVDRHLSSFLNRAYVPPDLINLVMRGDTLDNTFAGAAHGIYRRVVLCNTYANILKGNFDVLARELLMAPHISESGVSGSQTPTFNPSATQVATLAAELRVGLSRRFPLHCMRDLVSVVRQLYSKCLNRAVKGLHSLIGDFQKPNVNIPMRQRMALQVKPVYDFLLLHAVAAAKTAGNSSGKRVLGVGLSLGGGGGRRQSLGQSLAEVALNASVKNPYTLAPEPREDSNHTSSSLFGSSTDDVTSIDTSRYATLCIDIAREYTSAMGSTYAALFSSYLASIQKMCEATKVEAEDVLGVAPEVKRSGLLGMVKLGKSGKKQKSEEDRLRAFCLGQREVIAGGPDGLLAHICQYSTKHTQSSGMSQSLSSHSLSSVPYQSAQPQTLHSQPAPLVASQSVLVATGTGRFTVYPFERVFASCMQLLADTAVQESQFVHAFFGPGVHASVGAALGNAGAGTGTGTGVGVGEGDVAGNTPTSIAGAALSPVSTTSPTSSSGGSGSSHMDGKASLLEHLLQDVENGEEVEDEGYVAALTAIRNFRMTQALEGESHRSKSGARDRAEESEEEGKDVEESDPESAVSGKQPSQTQSPLSSLFSPPEDSDAEHDSPVSRSHRTHSHSPSRSRSYVSPRSTTTADHAPMSPSSIVSLGRSTSVAAEENAVRAEDASVFVRLLIRLASRMVLSHAAVADGVVTYAVSGVGGSNSLTLGGAASPQHNTFGGSPSHSHNTFTSFTSLTRSLSQSQPMSFGSGTHTGSGALTGKGASLYGTGSSGIATAMKLHQLHPASILASLFHRVFSAYYAFLEAYVSTSHDSIAMLSLLRIIETQLVHTHNHGVTALDAFAERCSVLLWNRFKDIYDANISSIQNLLLHPQSTCLSAHPLAVRYAEYVVALRRLNLMNNTDLVHLCCVRLLGEVQCALDAISDTLKHQELKIVFLINNYDAIVKTLIVRGLFSGNEGTLAQKPDSEHQSDENTPVTTMSGSGICDNLHEYRHFSSALTALCSQYVELAVIARFPALVKFVKEAEALAKKGAATLGSVVDGVSFEERALEPLATHFNRNWRKEVENLAKSAADNFMGVDKLLQMSSSLFAVAALLSGSSATANAYTSPTIPFTPPATVADLPADVAAFIPPLSGDLSKRVLLQLALYYKRFVDIVTVVCGRRQPIFMRELVPVASVMMEIKKHAHK